MNKIDWWVLWFGNATGSSIPLAVAGLNPSLDHFDTNPLNVLISLLQLYLLHFDFSAFHFVLSQIS